MRRLKITNCLVVGILVGSVEIFSAHATCPSLSLIEAKKAEEQGSYREWTVYLEEGKIFSEPKRSFFAMLRDDFKKELVEITEGMKRQGSGALNGKELCMYYVTNGESIASNQYLATAFILYKDKVLSLKELAALKVADLVKENVITSKDLEKLPVELLEELKKYSH